MSAFDVTCNAVIFVVGLLLFQCVFTCFVSSSSSCPLCSTGYSGNSCQWNCQTSSFTTFSDLGMGWVTSSVKSLDARNFHSISSYFMKLPLRSGPHLLSPERSRFIREARDAVVLSTACTFTPPESLVCSDVQAMTQSRLRGFWCILSLCAFRASWVIFMCSHVADASRPQWQPPALAV